MSSWILIYLLESCFDILLCRWHSLTKRCRRLGWPKLTAGSAAESMQSGLFVGAGGSPGERSPRRLAGLSHPVFCVAASSSRGPRGGGGNSARGGLDWCVDDDRTPVIQRSSRPTGKTAGVDWSGIAARAGDTEQPPVVHREFGVQ